MGQHCHSFPESRSIGEVGTSMCMNLTAYVTLAFTKDTTTTPHSNRYPIIVCETIYPLLVGRSALCIAFLSGFGSKVSAGYVKSVHTRAFPGQITSFFHGLDHGSNVKQISCSQYLLANPSPNHLRLSTTMQATCSFAPLPVDMRQV